MSSSTVDERRGTLEADILQLALVGDLAWSCGGGSSTTAGAILRRMVEPPSAITTKDLRLAELLAALSLACDLANAFPMEKALRNCLLAVSVARHMGMEAPELSDIYYVGLLRSIGCTSYAHEESVLAGDDISFRNTFAAVDFTHPPELVNAMFTRLGKGTGPIRRAKTVSSVMRQMKGFGPAMAAANCEAGARLSHRLGMSESVSEGLNQIYERWDGKGLPRGISGDEVSITALFGNFAHVVTVFHQPGRSEETCRMVKRRRGGEFSPSIVDVFLENSDELLSAIQADSVWDATLEAEPEPRRFMPELRLEELARAFAHFVDLKSPFTLEHSAGVAELAGKASDLLGLSGVEKKAVTVAGLLHDVGRVSVSNSIWEKPGALTPSEWERVRLHAYYTERILSHSTLLPYGRIAGLHHERLNESGYHRGVPAALLPVPARILAAADAYHAMTEDRPHRSALSPDEAAKELEAEVAKGRLDREAVAAVLATGGHGAPTPARTQWPAGLTEREIEVLRLVARGQSNKQIASHLVISDHTVHHHVLHIYQKAGVSTRAGAALFAMENDLLRGGIGED